MIFLVSADLAGEAPDLQSIEPWLEASVWEGAPPLGVFLSGDDIARYRGSEFAAVMALLHVPVADGETLEDFRAAAMAARIGRLTDEAAGERAAAAALRQDYMQLQESFLAVEGFLNGALAPRFVLARQWDFADNTIVLAARQTQRQALPVSSSALVAVDLWMVSGRVQVSLLRPDGGLYLDPLEVSGTGWQRVQFPAIEGSANDIALLVGGMGDAELGLTHPSPLPEFGETPLALRLWKGLSGVKLPDVVVAPKPRSFVMPGDLPKAESLGEGSAKYLESGNILMIHTDYYGAANLVFRGLDLGGAKNLSAHVQNLGPETIELTTLLVAAGVDKPARHCPSIFLAPEAYAQCAVQADEGEVRDLILKIKGQTSLDCLGLRGIEIG